MEQAKRGIFQGVANIVRFNWHFFILASIVIILAIVGVVFGGETYQIYFLLLAIFTALGTFVPLLISWYIYDLSGFYNLDWIDFPISTKNIANIHAGFDETSHLLQHKYPDSSLKVFDFYNPLVHTEVSIKRARKAYPAYPNTQTITTSQIPLDNASTDSIFIIFSAHEIRNDAERVIFFEELIRILNPKGKIVVVEHLRDFWNFVAYNIGFCHFLPHKTWLQTFQKANFVVCKQKSITPFVKLFILEKNEHSS